MSTVMTLSQLSKKSRGASRRAAVASSRRSRGSEIDDENDHVDVESQQRQQLERDSPKTKNGAGSRLLRLSSGGGGECDDTTSNDITPASPASKVPVRLLLRKIATAILTDIDDETLVRDDTETILVIITLLKEAIVGVIAAFALVSFVLLADHVFSLRLPTARNFRKATYAVMNDAETLRTFENDSGLKLVEMEDYDRMLREISARDDQVDKLRSIIEQRSAESIEAHAALDELKPKHERAFLQSGLDRFNGDGIAHGFRDHTCDWKVDYVMRKSQEDVNKPDVTKFEAMFDLMKKQKSCVKSKSQMMEDERLKRKIAAVREFMMEWDSKWGEEFRADGEWSDGTSCSNRADDLSKTYGYHIAKARAMTMVETNQCGGDSSSGATTTFDPFDPFCEGCVVDPEAERLMTCGGMMANLMSTEKLSEKEARLKVIETWTCVHVI